MSYKYIIFDVDDTLLNYGSAFYTAEKAIADYLKVEYSEECTLQVYKVLSEKYRLVLATNGIDRIQRERIQAFLPYTYKTYISENMNTIKPAEEFFKYIIDEMECDLEECLMVGDSMSNDMVGALDAGMDVCYYNNRNKRIPEGISVNYEIKGIEELLNILA